MNCKPGDLAIVIKAIHQESIGQIVIVDHFQGDIWGKTNVWAVKFKNPVRYLNPDSG